MTHGRRVTIEVTVAAAPDAVWRALREPAEVARWFCWEYDGLAEEIDQIFFSEVTVSDAERRLETADGTFEVEREPGAGDLTVVRVTRAAPTDEAGWDAMYTAIEEGWITFVQQLRFALERHPGEDRRTIYLAGEPGLAEARSPVEALGLVDAARRAPGRRYAATVDSGDELAGELWSISEQQIGMTVDGWGDGLLILAGRWTGRSIHGAAGAIITTYGLDDEAFTALKANWTAWWDARYPKRESEMPA